MARITDREGTDLYHAVTPAVLVDGADRERLGDRGPAPIGGNCRMEPAPRARRAPVKVQDPHPMHFETFPSLADAGRVRTARKKETGAAKVVELKRARARSSTVWLGFQTSSPNSHVPGSVDNPRNRTR